MATDRFPWTRDALEILITNWEKEPALFDKTDKSYSSNEERETAYANIQTEIRKVYPGCQLNLEQVRSKIISLRCQYNRERRRLHKKNGQSNSMALMKSPWWFRRLNFLSHYIVTRRSKYECVSEHCLSICPGRHGPISRILPTFSHFQSLAKSKGYLNYFSNNGRLPLAHEMLSISTNPLPHIPSNNSSFETDDSRVSSVFAEPSNTAHPNIKQEKQAYAEEDRLSYSGADDDDNMQSESSVSGQNSNIQLQSLAENGARMFQDSVLHNTSSLLHSIRQFMDQASANAAPTTNHKVTFDLLQ